MLEERYPHPEETPEETEHTLPEETETVLPFEEAVPEKEGNPSGYPTGEPESEDEDESEDGDEEESENESESEEKSEDEDESASEDEIDSEEESEDEEKPPKEEESLEDLLERINRQNTGEPDHDTFTVVCDVGKEDHRYFFYYSFLCRNKLFTCLYLLLPIALGVTFGFQGDGFAWWRMLLAALGFYLVEAVLLIIRTERKLARIKKESPWTLHTTTTSFTFTRTNIIHTRNGETRRIKYNMLKQVSASKKNVILYFDNNKAMILHTRDVQEVIPVKEFVAFLNARIRK